MDSHLTHILNRALYVMVAVSVLAGGIVLWTLNPSGNPLFPRCWFFSATNLLCPGCGIQRALHYLLRGDIVSAMRHNLFLFLASPILATAFFYWTQSTWFLKSTVSRTPQPRYLKMILLFTLSFWLLRNIPAYPFTLLSPPVLP